MGNALKRSFLLPRYRYLMTARIDYEVYRGTTDRTLRLATMPGAGLPAHVKRKDWVLMPAGKSPVHTDADRDIGALGYFLFQVVAGLGPRLKRPSGKRPPQQPQARSTKT